MAHTHDHSDNGGGFMSLAYILLAILFGGFAAVVGLALIVGGISNTRAIKHEAPAVPAPATAAAPAKPTVVGDVAIVNIKPGAVNPMSYDTASFSVKAGQKVKLTFTNENPTAPLQHNLVGLSNAMMANMAAAMAKGFIPEDPSVIVHTKLLNPKESETLEFSAPAEKGDYPYLCTFPGHSIIMNGTMKVE